MPINDVLNGINSASQVISGYLGEQEKQKEKQRVESTRKKMEQAMNSGDYRISMRDDGTIGLVALTPEDKIKAQKSQFELQELKRIIAKRDAGEPLTEAEEFMLTGYKKPAPNMWGVIGNNDMFNPPPQTPPPKPIPTGRVNVISPDGKRGSIPANQLQEALRAGYKQVR